MAARFSPGKILGGIGGFIGLVASVVGIWQYVSSTTSFDISGAWTIENTLQKTSYKPFEGMRETFKVTFIQNGTTFTGVGEKWSDDGQELTGPAHTPLEITGTVDRSGLIKADFTSHGGKRESSGGFTWRLSSDRKHGTGTFESTAAASSGASMLSR
jgi:hypothetical protein